MRKILIFCAAVFTLGACSNNDDFATGIPQEIRTNFQEMYPGAKGVEWDKAGVYKVATFSYNGQQLTAWYNQESVWCMTQRRMNLDEAPSRVLNAYKQAAGNVNNADYVDILTRDGIEDIYVVVEATGTIAEYYFSAEGILVKILAGKSRVYSDYRNEIVPQVPTTVYSTINTLYNGARIMEVDVIFPGVLYVDIIHDSILKTLEFSLTGSWTLTSWKVSENYVRTECHRVYSVYTEQTADTYRASDLVSIEYIETTSLAYFSFSMDDNGNQTSINITEEGKVIVVS